MVEEGHRVDAEQARTSSDIVGADAARHGAGLDAGHPARRRGDAVVVRAPTRWRRRSSKNSANFGKGAIEGVAAPEAANNAGAQASFIPMLTLGIPSNPVMALMIGAMIIQGIQPGPSVMTEQPALFWGLVVSMWIGNLFLLVLNLPLIGLWVKMMSVPYHFLYPAILVFCAIGVFSLVEHRVRRLLHGAVRRCSATSSASSSASRRRCCWASSWGR
ncbi:MAG: tripartite tricarboxylate transporter permease [Microthrixaceae bacterium]